MNECYLRFAERGLTVEFSPEDNTVILIEGVGTRITKITKTNIVIEDKLREGSHYSIHKGKHMHANDESTFL